MNNSLLQLVEPEAYQHAIAAEWESIPLAESPVEPSPEQLYNIGFGDGFGNRPQDKRFTWSLDYAAGYNNGLCEVFLEKPDMQFPIGLNHSERDEF